MHFASDNWAGAHPDIAASLTTHAPGHAAAYGASSLDKTVERRFSEIFERDVSVFFVATGTAANSLALTLVARPGGIVFAHRDAHIIKDECGAPEYLSGQLRISPVAGINTKMDPVHLRRQVAQTAAVGVHGGQPSAISMTQASEGGSVYSLDEIDAIAAVAREFKLPLHMDGARFANALVSLNCTPAEMTWKRGVDMLSFGGTKNGCWCAEAVIVFDPAKAVDFRFIRKRAAQLFSKSRFVSAQFDAYFRDGLWLELARHANDMATRLARAFVENPGVARLVREPQANEIFVVLKREMIALVEAEGAAFYKWPAPLDLEVAEDEELCRFVTSFATEADEVDQLRALLG